MTITCLLGIKTLGDRFVIRYGKDFEVHLDNDAELTPFLEFFYRDLKEGLESPVTEQKKRIGFHDGKGGENRDLMLDWPLRAVTDIVQVDGFPFDRKEDAEFPRADGHIRSASKSSVTDAHLSIS